MPWDLNDCNESGILGSVACKCVKKDPKLAKIRQVTDGLLSCLIWICQSGSLGDWTTSDARKRVELAAFGINWEAFRISLAKSRVPAGMMLSAHDDMKSWSDQVTINFVQRIRANLPDVRATINIAESSWNHHLQKPKHLSTFSLCHPPNSKGAKGFWGTTL